MHNADDRIFSRPGKLQLQNIGNTRTYTKKGYYHVLKEKGQNSYAGPTPVSQVRMKCSLANSSLLLTILPQLLVNATESRSWLTAPCIHFEPPKWGPQPFTRAAYVRHTARSRKSQLAPRCAGNHMAFQLKCNPSEPSM
jgi:hypothetical protein